jgi:hypothetical protein
MEIDLLVFMKQILIILSEPMMYNDSCSCDLQMNCSSHTMFKGLHIGCLPSESLFVSTLECLTLMKSELPNAVSFSEQKILIRFICFRRT